MTEGLSARAHTHTHTHTHTLYIIGALFAFINGSYIL